jgi:hypothetical protein
MPSKYNGSVVSRSPSKASRALVPSSNRQELALAPSMPRLTHAQGAWVPVGEVAYFMPCHDPHCHEAYYNGGHWRYYTQERFMTFDEIASLSQRQDFRNTIESSKPQGYIVEDITDKASLANEERKRRQLFDKQIAENPEGNMLADPDFGGINDNSPSVSVAGTSVSKSETVANLMAQIQALSRPQSVAGKSNASTSVSKSETVANLMAQIQALSRPQSVAGKSNASTSVSKSETVAMLQAKVAELSRPQSVAGRSNASTSVSKSETVAMLQAQIKQMQSSGSGISNVGSGISNGSSLARDLNALSSPKKPRKLSLQQQALLNASQQKPKRRIEDLGVDVSTNSRDKMFKQEDGTASVVSRASKTSGMSHISGLTGLTGLGKDENQIG